MELKFSAFVERKENSKQYLIVRRFPVPLHKSTVDFEVELPDLAIPLVFYTATTGMIETIGNMVGQNIAVGYAFHNQRHKFKVNNPLNIADGERVYITEHLRLDGKPEYLVTKHRILQGQNNFVNFGHRENGTAITKLIVDVITGEHKWV